MAAPSARNSRATRKPRLNLRPSTYETDRRIEGGGSDLCSWPSRDRTAVTIR